MGVSVNIEFGTVLYVDSAAADTHTHTHTHTHMLITHTLSHIHEHTHKHTHTHTHNTHNTHTTHTHNTHTTHTHNTRTHNTHTQHTHTTHTHTTHTHTQIIGLALIAGGAYLIASGSNLSFLTGNGIASGAAIIIICGGVTLIITAIGLLGAFGLWRPLLVIVSEKKRRNSSLINSQVFDHCSVLCIRHSLVPSLSTPGLEGGSL